MFYWLKFIDAADITKCKKRHSTVTVPSWKKYQWVDRGIRVPLAVLTSFIAVFVR